MTQYTMGDLNVDYPEVNRHWHENSESYAGGDCLLTALRDGWVISDTVFREEHWHAGVRLVTVYHFTLKRGDETCVMPVVTNPYIHRLVRSSSLEVVPMNDNKRVRSE
ncbi:MAG: hypothetical protein D6737_12720 [Chloroflexi bacterium]|nr:MAG: hypothetical protein D6737_12720 [Chloroflexota bacterium]